MIHRRNFLTADHGVGKASTATDSKQPERTSKAIKLNLKTWNKHLDRLLQDPLLHVPANIRYGPKARLIVVGMMALILIVSSTLTVATWVDTWATSILTMPITVPYELVSNPPLIEGIDVMPYNQIYHVPESHPQVGDRSDAYARLRQETDRRLPFSPSRSLQAVKDLRQAQGTNYTTKSIATYDIYNCPESPPPGYPFAWALVDVLSVWPPKDTTPVPERSLHQGLCVFQFPQDFHKALAYKNQEVPFVIQGDPHIARTVERWNHPGYLSKMLGGTHRTEYSPNNHFLYRVPGAKQSSEGTQLQWMAYDEWLARANVTQDRSDPNQEHWYFRLLSCGSAMGNQGKCDKRASEYLFDEMPYFQPTWQANHSGVAMSTQLYMGDEGYKQRGINCRFGMRGVIAENHFDSGRNVIVVLGGSRRYILAHPNQCRYMSLYDSSHPSARHSNFDWSTGDPSSYPDIFAENAKGNEVVLQAGDAMYLPTFWFHYIVSLELNFQCNTRSGIGMEYATHIESC